MTFAEFWLTAGLAAVFLALSTRRCGDPAAERTRRR
jgi:hypothetical protein